MIHAAENRAVEIAGLLGRRRIVLVGLMGAGKTALGRRVAQLAGIPFVDSDHEIEDVSRMSIPDIFETYGETEFRALEQRVVTRLVAEGPGVLATGGGAFMNPATREAIGEHGVSVWLNADIDTLMERVSKRSNRPLLQNADPRGVLQRLMDERHPVYALADVTVSSRDTRHNAAAMDILEAVGAHLAAKPHIMESGE